MTQTWLAVKGCSNAVTYGRELVGDQELSVDEQLIHSLHFMLQGHNLSVCPGRYRRTDVHVVEQGSATAVYTGLPLGCSQS